jgi:N-acetylneuraminate lyase
MCNFKLIAASHTPFDPNGRVNFKSIEKQYDILVRNGIKTVFICGSTGEFCSLSTQERKDIADCWMKTANGDVEVMIHVGHNSVADAAELAMHARKVGAVAVATNAPSYYKPASVDDLVGYCKTIADSADGLPFYFYHLPSITGVNFSMVDFLKKGSDRIENLAGIKYTGMNIVEYYECLNFDNKRFDLLYGNDEQLLLPLSMGAAGAVGSTYNYAAPLYWKLIKSFAQSDSRAVQQASEQIFTLISILFEFGVMAGGKAIMGLLGVDCGSPRSPLKGLSAEQIKTLKRKLEQSGLFELMLNGHTVTA